MSAFADRLRQITDDPAWPAVLRMAAAQLCAAGVEMRLGDLSDATVHAALTGFIHGQARLTGGVG